MWRALLNLGSCRGFMAASGQRFPSAKCGTSEENCMHSTKKASNWHFAVSPEDAGWPNSRWISLLSTLEAHSSSPSTPMNLATWSTCTEFQTQTPALHRLR
ncbi:hypothetical protein Pelo_7239 [Pelomyxa schiedti]|nr:hypothetical protein Pelo_7239 [Pelomyxa schiedti]